MKELLKVTSVLYNAMKTNIGQADNGDEDDSTPVSFDISSRVSSWEFFSTFLCMDFEAN